MNKFIAVMFIVLLLAACGNNDANSTTSGASDLGGVGSGTGSTANQTDSTMPNSMTDTTSPSSTMP
jgi:ABC-type glycerol-3-phosphate transport system substrate-binding protein